MTPEQIARVLEALKAQCVHTVRCGPVDGPMRDEPAVIWCNVEKSLAALATGRAAEATEPEDVVSLCVQCGPNVNVDEDGICMSCGCDALPTPAVLAKIRAALGPPPSPAPPTCWTCEYGKKAEGPFPWVLCRHLKCPAGGAGIPYDIAQTWGCTFYEPTPSPSGDR